MPNTIYQYNCNDIKSIPNCFSSSFYIDIVHQNSLSKIINSFRKHEERENIIYSPFCRWWTIYWWLVCFTLHLVGGNNYPWRNQFTFTLLFVCLLVHSKIYHISVEKLSLEHLDRPGGDLLNFCNIDIFLYRKFSTFRIVLYILEVLME